MRLPHVSSNTATVVGPDADCPEIVVAMEVEVGARARIRTGGLPLRRRLLYPAELHARVYATISVTETYLSPLTARSASVTPLLFVACLGHVFSRSPSWSSIRAGGSGSR